MIVLIKKIMRSLLLMISFLMKISVPLIVEINYRFYAKAYDYCPSFWTSYLEWHEGRFNPQGVDGGRFDK